MHQRGVKPHRPAAAWLRNVFRPRLRSERTFGQCSPSPEAPERQGAALLARRNQFASTRSTEENTKLTYKGAARYRERSSFYPRWSTSFG